MSNQILNERTRHGASEATKGGFFDDLLESSNPVVTMTTGEREGYLRFTTREGGGDSECTCRSRHGVRYPSRNDSAAVHGVCRLDLCGRRSMSKSSVSASSRCSC